MKNRTLIPIIVVSIIALGIIIARAAGITWPFRILGDQIFNPIGARLVSVRNSVGGSWGFVTNIGSLGSDNKRLGTEIVDLRQQLSSLKEVARENELMRGQLNFNARLNFQLVPARVVSLEPDSLRRYITIDRGSSSGVKKGQAVVSSGILVGTIDEVNDYSSRVFLVSDPDFRLRGIGQDGRAQGIISGQIGQGYSFEKIAQGEVVSSGEQIITAGSGLVPQGILIGQVETVAKTDNGIFQSAVVRSLVDLNSLELVFVITGLKQ